MGTAASSTIADVERALARLKRRGTAANRTGMARYAIVAPKVFGTSVGEIRALGRTLRGRHDLAEPLWATGWYEARMLDRPRRPARPGAADDRGARGQEVGAGRGPRGTGGGALRSARRRGAGAAADASLIGPRSIAALSGPRSRR